ncbi:DUF177 domain-containing protein [Bifidobacterium sp. ESL0704]|uniref:YceD family protein n=1 Tax=Bifidobacterium sp. ESL0704 TaxID=2983219 RepID=UPI0023FA3559|nr:DUF177 domain-containing protein [Bifidobacterium sp. ESL0704]WEV53235.1 DUF177 domain-containing protein [Bifidobacterium sp. ESL0704]
MSRPEDSQWAVSVGQIVSRPGQSKTVDADFPAPSGIGDNIIGVKEGAPVKVSGSFDSIVDGLIFNGHFDAPVHAECVRCLTPIKRSWSMAVTAFFPYDSAKASVNADSGRGKHDEDIDIIAGEDESEDTYPLSPDCNFADLETLLRDTLVEQLPLQPLCRPDCKGLCSQCGINLNDNPDHHHDVVDNRFSALASLKTKLEKEEGAAESNRG